nr:hypothetical protein [uncultured Cohaesibacter sp.]
MNSNNKKLSEIIAVNRNIKSRSGFDIDPSSNIWTLYSKSIDFGQLEPFITNYLLEKIKKIFTFSISGNKLSDNSVIRIFNSVRDFVRCTSSQTNSILDDFSDDQILQWLDHPPAGTNYPAMLKIFIYHGRKSDPDIFPNVTDTSLKMLRNPEKTDYVVTLDPEKGPWLEGEVAIQDKAIEEAYAKGQWTDEKYLIVQLPRHYGMRPGSLSRMKISDVHIPSINPIMDDPQPQIRWPFEKNDLSIHQAHFWPIGGSVLNAMEAYLAQRLIGIPKAEWYKLPLFTPKGLPGSFGSNGLIPEPSKEIGYEGHATEPHIEKRFKAALDSLGLTTSRSGEEKKMVYNFTRERHTVATRKALKGYSAAQIGLFLGHASEASCQSYVDLATLCYQLRDPKFFRLMDKYGDLWRNPVVSREIIETKLDPVISTEAMTNNNLEDVALIGGGECQGCPIHDELHGSEPWPCLSCHKFQIYENADFQLLWDILNLRKSHLYDENGNWNNRFDPDVMAQLQRYEAMIIGAEMRRQDAVNAKLPCGGYENE